MWTLILFIMLAGVPEKEITIIEIPTRADCEMLRENIDVITEAFKRKLGRSDVQVTAGECSLPDAEVSMV